MPRLTKRLTNTEVDKAKPKNARYQTVMGSPCALNQTAQNYGYSIINHVPTKALEGIL